MATRFNVFWRKSINCSQFIFKKDCRISCKCFQFCEKRNYSSLEKSSPESRKLLESELSRKFKAVIPEMIQTIVDTESKAEIPGLEKSLRAILEYNVFDGKQNRGFRAIIAYHILSSKLDEENLKLASMLGWCVELLQASYLVHDDIVDEAEMRRGRLCWYRFQDNGLNAINDGVFLDKCIFVVLRKYFRNNSNYVDIIEAFQEVGMKTCIGQLLDTTTSKNFLLKRKFDQFTSQNYFNIVNYKTAYYTLQLPVVVTMYMVGIEDKKLHEKVTNILLKIGTYYQIQDDFLDCFGNKELIGKSGNDIEQGKCTWLIVNALNRANAEQRSKLQENYGRSDADKVENVVKIYNEIGLKDIYDALETEIYNEVMIDINELADEIPPELFTLPLNIMYRRKC